LSIVRRVPTLIVSDLHLGQRPGHDVLRQQEPLERLLSALTGIDRLVLLGDIVELAVRRHGHTPLRIAAPILRAIGERMGPEREIVLVPGNHDAALVRNWAFRRGQALGLSDEVPTDVTPALAGVVELLAPARVAVRYPGMWVRDDVWATHGHYLDRHLVPEATFGLPRGRLARERPPEPTAAAIDYELARRRRRSRPEGLWAELMERPLAVVLEHLAELSRYGTYLLRGIHLTTLTARMLDLQVRRAAVPALVEAAGRLGVDARVIVFGHVHRAGPVAGTWQPRAGGPRVYNTGSWLYEPLLLDRAAPPHPYWPGGAVLVPDAGEPRVLRLLDQFNGDQLSRGSRDRDR
jgi:UDP-2,3-diacylglucosamine pyrophosphatase LpxH